MARNLTGEDLLQIELLPAATIRHKDLVLIRIYCLDHVLGGILLVIQTGGGRVWVAGYAGVGRVGGQYSTGLGVRCT